jgi:signal transduction histidine kinase
MILLDIMMPEMDGFEVCRRLKADAATREIPVIFISAMDDIKDKVRAFNAGGVDYITKPFEPEEVLARVATHLKLGILQKELEEQNAMLKETLKKQLEQEQMMIEQSKMAAMGEMISAIAHQWRQPLNALGLYIQDIKDAFNFGELDEAYIERITKDSMHQIHFMSDTIDDFRNYFVKNREKREFSLLESINKTAFILAAQFKTHNVAIRIDAEEVRIVGYENEFKQVLLNLINNAKDAIFEIQEQDKQFAGTILIRARKLPDGSYELIIQDNGGGVDASIMKNIFEPYFTTKFQKQGTGIGLYMVKEIIERHFGGTIACTNEAGGARFTVTLPTGEA